MRESGGSVLEIFQILKLVVCGLKISNILDVTFLIDSTIWLNYTVQLSGPSLRKSNSVKRNQTMTLFTFPVTSFLINI